MIKNASLSYTTDASQGSWLSTINPLSQLSTSNKPDYMPEWWDKYIPASSPDTRYLLWKSAVMSLMAAAIVGGGRLIQHIGKVNEIRQTDQPGHALNNQMGSSFEMTSVAKKKKKKKGGWFSSDDDDETEEDRQLKTAAEDWLGVAVPTGAALLTAALTYAATDAWADKRKGEILQDRVANKNDYLKKLIIARARNAKGKLTERDLRKALRRPDFEDAEIQIKQGANDTSSSISAAVGLLALGLLGVTTYGSYKYFEANNPNNIKYKAYKKGLEEYAATRSNKTPLTVGSSDAEIFKKIDETDETPEELARKKKKLQEGATPLLLEDKHTPVSITL